MDDDRSFREPVELPGERPHYSSPKFKPKRPLLEVIKKPFLVVAALLALAGAGYGVWKLIPSKKDAGTPTTQSNQAPPQAQEAAKSDVPEASLSETYKSSALGLDLQYPKTWKAVEKDGGIRLISPNFTYQTVGSGDKTGNFRIYIRKGAREADGKYIGAGVAIKPSEKLVYTSPGVGQRSDTLISSFGIDGADNFSFFLLAGNFQLNKGDTLGPNYGREPDTFIIAGGYSSDDLADDLATNPVPIDFMSNSKAYSQALEIIKSIKL